MNAAPTIALAGLIVATLLVLALRMADETERRPRNHLVIAGGSLLAFGLAYRLVDVVDHGGVRWSAVIGAAGMLAFLAADQRVAARYGALWRGLAGSASTYTGPDRRRRPRPEGSEERPSDEAP